MKLLNSSPKEKQGFTLIELLVVIGILAVLLAITLVAINPGRQFAQANNTQRRSDVTTILNAVHQYGVDNAGDLSALGIGTTATEVSSDGTDLCSALVPDYVAALPVDPGTGDEPITSADCDSYSTGYEIVQGDSDRVTVSAPNAQLGTVISVTK